MPEARQPGAPDEFDVVIIGAGLSGIAGAHHLQQRFPKKRICILEMRASLGGTWDQFTYPGVRSDSAMSNFAYGFKPFALHTHLADGHEILKYITETSDENGIAALIRYNHRVVSQSWSSKTTLWSLEVLVGREEPRSEIICCAFILGCTGYYDFDRPPNVSRPGQDAFVGTGRQVLHPQFWPSSVHLTGKRVVVVGSGATAVSLVPELAKLCDHVIVVQRSPSHVFPMPRHFSRGLSLLYTGLAYMHLGFALRCLQAAQRWMQIRMDCGLYAFCIAFPALTRHIIWWAAAACLGGKAQELKPHFTPRHDPWTQRVCLDADGGLFRALRLDKASIHTSALESFSRTGIRLADGRELDCDVVVTATGLALVGTSGTVRISVDGEHISLGEQFTYRGVMVSGIPNYVCVLGYINLSWTVRAELVLGWACRLMEHLQQHQLSAAVPVVPERELRCSARRPFAHGFSPTYITRDASLMPQQLDHDPWLLHNLDHARDAKSLSAPIGADGALRFY
jgi:cation diffusion facilitator CzcD-associated flavoprotein CzcO